MSGEVYSYSQPIMAKAVPYDEKTSPLPAASENFNSDSNVYGDENPGPWVQDDAIERSSNIFNQLDSMIAAVHSESNALDSMRDKLKELDGMKRQISNLTKRLLEADQANITCKGNLIRLQEECTAAKKSKTDLEIQHGQIKLELQRTKDAYGKERQGRMAAQQDIVNYKEHISRLEKTNHDLQYEVKNSAVHHEANDLLKADLQKVRSQYQNDKQQMQAHIKQLEAHLVACNTEGLKAEMRGMANRLMDLVNGHGNNNGNGNGNAGGFNRASIPVNMGLNGAGNGRNGIAAHSSPNSYLSNSKGNGAGAGYNLNMNAVGMMSAGSGLATNSSANSYHGNHGDLDDPNSDISGIYDMNSVATGVGNASLHDDDDAYYTNLMQQTQMAAQLENSLQQKRQHQQAQQQQQPARGKQSRKKQVARVVDAESEEESEEEEEDDLEDEPEPEPQPEQRSQRRKSKQKSASSGSSVGSQGSKNKGKGGSLPKI